MYTGFYGLTTDPFCLSPDPRFRFMHPSYRKAKAYMQYALHRAEGFILVTGVPGTGKTTLVKEMLDELHHTNINIAKLVSTQVGADDLLRLTAYGFGISEIGEHKASIIRQLEVFLEEQYRLRRRNLLIVDEAQDLSPKALEELRLLTNLEQTDQPILQIFLVGQQQLLNLVRLSNMEQLNQRIIAACTLQPLSREQVMAYVLHRLRTAGWKKQNPKLESRIFPLLHRFSQGIPRRINQLCSRLFLHGYVESKHHLTVGDVIQVIEELRTEQFRLVRQDHTREEISAPGIYPVSVSNGD